MSSKRLIKLIFGYYFQQLITKDFLVFIIKILAYWYCHQEMHVRLGSTSTSSFMYQMVLIKQGGILSPMLFNVYIDQLSIRFSRSGIGGDIGSHLDQCKYLGSMICPKNCDIDLKRQMRKFYANINILSRKFAECSPDVKCPLFKYFCSSLYYSTMWYNETVTAMRKLRIAYNNSHRRLLGIPKYNSASEMYVQLNIKSFVELLRKYVFCFINR